MNSSHTETLRRLIDQIIAVHQNNDFPISKSDLEVVRDHASILVHGNQTSYANLDFEELFKVPELNNPRNVQVASFIGFLVQLLIGKPHFHVVMTELRYFNTILLDSPFQNTDENHSRVQTLLSQFETLANECGRLVYSFLFSPHPPPINKIDEILSEPIIRFNLNVIKFFNSSPYINTTPNTFPFALSSVFIIDSFLYDLENLMNRKDNSILEVKTDVEKLHRSLKHSWSLLNKHYDDTDELKQIVMLSFDAEYLVNYFLSGDAPAWYLALRLPHIIHNVELIGRRLQEMLSENHDDDRTLQEGDHFAAALPLQTGKSSGVDDTTVGFKDEEHQILKENSGVDDTTVGFKDEEHQILKELVRGGEGMRIISIIGMPGLGKTTLAKKMYSHPTVRERFDRISWCIVSQAYKMKKLLVEILTCLDFWQVKEATLAGESEDELGVRIHKTLKGRRYFIVVDDIWECSPLEYIKRYFPDDGNGSRILLTSRNKEVADQCNSTIHELPLFSNEQCWELLQKKVFHGESCPQELRKTGANIAAQCNGLPLEVVVVSGILSTMKKDLSEWETVRQTLDSSKLSYQDRGVAKSLELSYMNLPHHLKPCFLYFGRFREDEQIIVKEVVRLWIAEGFIPVDKGNKAEVIAKEYMNVLIAKNLIMVAEKNYKGEAKVCAMHDLLRDMCLKIVEDDNFLTVADGDNSCCDHRVQRIICYPDSNGWFQPYSKFIRSFVCGKWYSQLKVGHKKVVRVLGANTWPNDIGIQNLVHLRYLKDSRMPQQIDRFSNLEFLILYGYIHISSSFLDAMRKLRYLRAYHGVHLDNIDCNIPPSYSLGYISNVIISSPEHVQQLKVFPHIRKLVCRMYNSGIPFDLSLFKQLESLTFHNWAETTVEITLLPFSESTIIKLSLNECALSQEQMSIIGALPRLEVLKLECVNIGEKWETRDDEFQKLKYLKLEFIEELVEWNVSSSEHFPVLQQLIIDECNELKEIPSEIGCISTLLLISVTGECTRQMKESINKLKEQLKEDGNEDVTIVEDVATYYNDVTRETAPIAEVPIEMCPGSSSNTPSASENLLQEVEAELTPHVSPSHGSDATEVTERIPPLAATPPPVPTSPTADVDIRTNPENQIMALFQDISLSTPSPMASKLTNIIEELDLSSVHVEEPSTSVPAVDGEEIMIPETGYMIDDKLVFINSNQ